MSEDVLAKPLRTDLSVVSPTTGLRFSLELVYEVGGPTGARGVSVTVGLIGPRRLRYQSSSEFFSVLIKISHPHWGNTPLLVRRPPREDERTTSILNRSIP